MKRTFFSHITCCVVLAGALCLLAGCGTSSRDPGQVMPLLPQAMPMDPPNGSGMLSLNTYAGDALAKELLVRMGSGAGILTTNLVELDDFERTSAFGRLASQQIASRIGQHGFRVIESRLGAVLRMNRQGEFMMTRDSSQLLTTEYDAGAVLVGAYKVIGERIFISTRIVRIADNVVMGAYEYYLPLNNEVRALLGPASAGGVSPSISTARERDVWARYAARGQAVPAPAVAPVAKPVPKASAPAVSPATPASPAKDSPYPLPLNEQGSIGVTPH
ncbi:hypothetical protein LJC23_01915 [Desulfovibrio sp. OttesenSCG-928-I05]|nr:hypothetical protein [Desulfovibrio sp. OttesenSCG-928-I05]